METMEKADVEYILALLDVEIRQEVDTLSLFDLKFPGTHLQPHFIASNLQQLHLQLRDLTVHSSHTHNHTNTISAPLLAAKASVLPLRSTQ